MAIIAPTDLPEILKVDSNPMKKYVMTMLGHPVTDVEMTEDQWETILKVSGDFIAHYFDREEQLAWFYTDPLISEYDMPENAYWIKEVKWDPATTRIGDVFGAESFLFNIGNITGIQNILTDYHLLQAYRKFSQRVLGTEGHWEWTGDKKIRLFPTPKGAMPVVVEYYPPVDAFRSPQARKLANDMLLAESMIVLGHARSKFNNIPSPDGSSMTLNGTELVTKGEELKKEIIELANQLEEPMQFYLY